MSLDSLKTLPLFHTMSDMDLDLLRGHCRWAWFQPNEVLVRQGQSTMDFSVVVTGRVEVLLEGEHSTSLTVLGPGDFWGELTALSGEPSGATLVAREVTSVLMLDKDGLLQLVERNGQLSRELIARLAGRVQHAAAKLHRARLRERTLSDHLARQGALAYSEWLGSGVWSVRIRAAIARGSKGDEPVLFVGESGTGKELAAARTHYNSHRREGPFIVLDVTNYSSERWQEALRLAAHGSLLLKHAHLAPERLLSDVRPLLPSSHGGRRQRLPSAVPRILATAGASEDREPSALERLLLAEGFGVPVPSLRERREDIPLLARHLVLRFRRSMHREGSVNLITGDALRKLQTYPFLSANVRELEWVLREAASRAGDGPVRSEHLQLGAPAVRMGRPRVALALGGGVVRGAAHIGVLKALTEAGIPIDLVVGTSSGSLVGALYAGGMDPARMEAIMASMSWLSLAEPCWPRGGFLTSRRMKGLLDRFIGQIGFEQLKLPFAAVAGDANSGEEVILRRGSVADAVRASTAIPGVFRPVEVEGRLLMDGVVVNNVPASVARSLGADLVIAVDITQYGFTAGPPRALGDAIMRAFDIMARQTISASLEWADVVIRPQVAGLNGFSFKSAPEYSERGYQATRAAIPAIRERLEQLRRELLA